MWVCYLPWTEFNYNAIVHSSSGFSHFHIIFWKPPSFISVYVVGSSSIEVCDFVLLTHDEIFVILDNNLRKAQVTMNDSSNKHHCVCIISVDLWVYVKLCPHRQTTVSDSKYTKLSKCYYGLFCVLERIRVVANRLDPPLTSKIDMSSMFSC